MSTRTRCPRRAALAGAFVASVLVAASAFARSDPGVAPASGDAQRGATLYQACMGCHSIDEDDVGPRHRGVVGRRAGAVAGFAYSPALANSHLVWDRATLDRWLENPQALVPGTRMFFAMPNPTDRADVIAYLATPG